MSVTTPTPPSVDCARCQKCGGEIQGWVCQQCHQEFEENDAGEIVFCPPEGVDWSVVGPKLVEALEFYAKDHECPSDGPWGLGSTDYGDIARAALSTFRRAALAAAQPEGK